MSQYEWIAVLYVIYNMSMTIATNHINGSEHYSMDPFLNTKNFLLNYTLSKD